jgi:hypothetical protein
MNRLPPFLTASFRQAPLNEPLGRHSDSVFEVGFHVRVPWSDSSSVSTARNPSTATPKTILDNDLRVI